MLLNKCKIVLVDERSTGSATQDTNGQRDEHQTSRTGAPSLSFLVDNGIARNDLSVQSENTRKAVPTYATKNMYSKPYKTDM